MATENAFLDKFGVTVLWNSLKNYINKVMPKKISAFSNDEGYIKGISTLTFTGAQEVTFDGKHNVTINIPNSPGEVTPGTTNYNDLTNKPSINGILLSGNKTLSNLGINIPTRVSQLSNDADYLTSSSLIGYVKRTDLTNVAFTGSYNSLTNKPTIPVVPSNVSAFYNDAGYLTTHQDISGKVDYSELNSRLSNIYTKADVDALIDEIQTEGDGKVNLRNYYTKDAADGRFQPIGNYLTSHQDISGKANTADLKAVAFSGNYSDLINKPIIPSSQNTKTINNESIYGTGNIDTKEILYYDLDVSATEQEDSTYSIENTELYNIIKNNPNKLVVLRSVDEDSVMSLRYEGYYSSNGEIIGYMFEGYVFGRIAFAVAGQTAITISIIDLSKKEDTDNKVTSITDSHNTADYPTAIAVRNALSTKQNTLVSGENIKTINGNSILGSGNITIQGGSGGKIYYYSNDDYNVVYDGDAAITSFDDFLTESIYNAVFQNYSGGLVYRLSGVKYYEGYEAALNKINLLVFTAYWISTNSIIKKDFYISRTYENDPYDYSVVSVDTPIASFNATTLTLDIETTSSSTIPVPAEETLERWVDDGTICVGYDKHVNQKRQISNDGGVTWSDTSETRTGSLIETNSTDCGYNPGGGGDTDDYANQYFTIESWDDDNVISWKASGTTKTVSVSTNNGSTWTDYTSSSSGTPIATLNANDKILIKGSNSTYGVPGGSHSQFASSKRFNVKGNIMSLINGDNFAGTNTLTDSYSFAGLFDGCSQLIYADELILPAMTLTSYCYYNMFRGCSMLQTVPELPATTLAPYCYSNMFSGCNSINSTPELPATALANSCYLYMFVNCFSLATAKPLPATTLAKDCYNNMFCNCTSLTTAPVLPATRLDSNMTGCYAGMFRGCTSLNYIKALIASVYTSSYTSSADYTRNWVEDVASTGIFVKNSTSSWNVSGVDGIPTGWTVQTASA